MGFVQSGGPKTLRALRDRLGRGNADRLVVALACLAAVVVVGVFGTRSYRDHAGVQGRALKQLEATASASFASKNHGVSDKASRPSRSGSGVSGAGSVALPIGEVDAASPVAAGVVTPLPVASGSSTVPTISGGSSGGSGGSPPPPPTQVDVAVLSPFLDTLAFGASVGFLLTCNTAAGSVSAAASQVPGLSQVITPVLTQISPDCGMLSAEAVSNLNTFNQELGVLQGLTPASAPYFAELNMVFATLNTLSPELEPFTATITALGPLVDFFGGQPSGS